MKHRTRFHRVAAEMTAWGGRDGRATATPSPAACRKIINPDLLLFLTLLLSPLTATAQNYRMGNTVIVGYGGAASMTGRSGAQFSCMTITINEPISGTAESANFSTTFGQWSFYNREPSPLFLTASEGDYAYKVVLTWKNDALQPPVTEHVRIYRENTLLANPLSSNSSYDDGQVMPGNFYNYAIEAQNAHGWGARAVAVGFVNPNGVITGNVRSPHGNPVANVEVSLSPNLGKALRFDTGEASVPAPGFEKGRNLTVELWVKINSSAGGQEVNLVSDGESAQDFGWALTYRTDTRKLRAYLNTTSQIHTLDSDSTLKTGQWHHLALAANSDTGRARLFIDGAGDRTQNYSGALLNTGNKVFIGKDNRMLAAAATMDEVRIWNYSRPLQEIKRDKDRHVSGSTNGLLAYWRIDEGTGDFVFDLTSNNRDAKRNSAAAWVDDHPNLHVSAFTNEKGDYNIEGIYYGDGTTFTVRPAKPGHLEWNPESRLVTLNPSSTSEDRVDFIDDSVINASGFIQFANTTCPVKGAEIKKLVNDETVSLVPPIFTDSTGYFSIDFEPGSSHQLVPVFKDHTFEPAFRQVTDIAEPLNLGVIKDTRTRRLTGGVAGGRCQYPIGKAEVIIQTTSGCFARTVISNDVGKFEVSGLPAAEFEVFIGKLADTVPPPDVSSGRKVSLIDGDNTVMFIHHEPLQVKAIWPANAQKCRSTVVNQYDSVRVRIDAFEAYYDPLSKKTNHCYLDTGKVTVDDHIAGQEGKSTLHIITPDTATAGPETMPTYTLVPGVPNLLSGGEHPYQKNLSVTVQDTSGWESPPVTEWAYVMGHKPRTKTFTTKLPHTPLLILHDPPGDQSYVELDQETSHTLSWSLDFATDASVGAWIAIKVGAAFLLGFGMSVETQVSATTKAGWSVGFSFERGHEWSTSVVTTEVFQTSSSEDLIGEDGDVFIGGALNVIYGLTDVLTWNDSACAVVKDTTLAVAPNGFDTFYLYTESHIRDNIIPQLRHVLRDTASANLWEQYLAMNDSLKANAVFDRNLSFDAGAPYSHSEQVSRTDVVRLATTMEISQEIATEIEAEIAGSGISGGVDIHLGINLGSSQTVETSQTNTTIYVLSDDDTGDFFSVDVKHDRQYGTPAFDLKAGASSCPWEPGTQPRQGAQLLMDSYVATNVPQNGQAVFALAAGNTSESEEEMEYEIRAIEESNPYGAVLKINGEVLGSAAIPLTIPAGEQKQLTLTVERGPHSSRYDDLQLMMYSPCDEGNIANTVTFSVHFESLCESNIAISYPKDGWLVNQDDGNKLHLTVAGYDRTNPNFVRAILEYAHTGGSIHGAQWFVADTISVDTIRTGPTNFIPWVWQVAELRDGPYWIRVKSECRDGNFMFSDPLSGKIDRNALVVFGVPEPADGVLGPDDEISITFARPVDCSLLFPGDLDLFNETRNFPVPIKVPFNCRDNVITIVPDAQNHFLENDRLRATISGIRSLDGNGLGKTLSWEFVVDRNPVHWNQPQIDTLQQVGEKLELLTTLRNIGASEMSFEFSGEPFWASVPAGITPLPWWISISSRKGQLEPGGEARVTITISDLLNSGLHQNTIYAHTPMGDEPFILQVRTLCAPPLWVFDPGDFQYSMSVNAQIKLRDAISSDPHDRIGAFVGSECRGVANLEYVPALNRYQAFLTIHGNQQNGEQVRFRLWDAADCEEYWEIDTHVPFVNGQVIGSPARPIVLNATGAVAQSAELQSGWTWFSVHLNHSEPNMNINSAMAGERRFKSGDRIIQQDQFESWSETQGKWLPGTMVLNPRTMYKAHLDTLSSPVFVGFEINVDSLAITLNPNWNWLGYPLRVNQPIEVALRNLKPGDGSTIKDEVSFAEYVDSLGQWIGNLQWLKAGDGYMYKSTANSAMTFTYAQEKDGSAGALGKPSSQSPEEVLALPWKLDPSTYPHNMPVILRIEDAALNVQTIAVAALVGNEVRGIARPELIPALSECRVFMMVYGREEKGETVSFQIFDGEGGRTFEADEVITFTAAEKIGSVFAPLTVKSLGEFPTSFHLSQNYPNPFNPETTFAVGVPEASHVEIAVFDLLGRQVTVLADRDYRAGNHRIKWNGTDQTGRPLATGLYIAKMKAGSFVQTRKVVLLK